MIPKCHVWVVKYLSDIIKLKVKNEKRQRVHDVVIPLGLLSGHMVERMENRIV